MHSSAPLATPARYFASLLTLAFLCTAYVTNCESTPVTEDGILLCLVRQYKLFVSNDMMINDEVLQCNDTIWVDSCFGRCDSQEVPTYEVPYKISSHPVCTYGTKSYRRFRLTQCDPRHPDPFKTVVQAETCACQTCDPSNTNCGTLT